jgi:hypothetical protein
MKINSLVGTGLRVASFARGKKVDLTRRQSSHFLRIMISNLNYALKKLFRILGRIGKLTASSNFLNSFEIKIIK